jgi:hypothetical protein
MNAPEAIDGRAEKGKCQRPAACTDQQEGSDTSERQRAEKADRENCVTSDRIDALHRLDRRYGVGRCEARHHRAMIGVEETGDQRSRKNRKCKTG